MLTDAKVLSLVRERTSELITQWTKYQKRWSTFVTGETLKKKEGWDIKTHINYFYRFCKTHASYIVKDTPNIQVPAEHPDQIESKMKSANIERWLYMRWLWNKFPRKLKTAALRGSVFGDMYFMLSFNKKAKWIDLDIVDPTQVVYDTEDSDPLSPISFVLKVKMIDVKKLREEYPDKVDIIKPSNEADQLLLVNNFTKSNLWSEKKACVYTYMDDKYIYTVLNGMHVLNVVEHKYPFIPFYHRPYIDVGDKYGFSMIDILYEAVKTMHLSLSFMITNAYDTAQAPLVSTGGNPTWDKVNWPKGLLTLPANWLLNYLQPPMGSADLYKTMEYAKVFMHFISGISEEAMAWFTGALTSAGVSIELRLDSTVREAVDSQIVLKDILENINADWLKLMEKFLPKENILRQKNRGEYGKLLPFTGNMIGGQYITSVDFGGILPRSEATLVNNVLAKHKMWLISTDTALEELRYQDPTMELSKKLKESVDRAKLEKAIQSGQTDSIAWYEWPKDENYAMIADGKIAPVTPEQNHQEHWLEHNRVYSATNNPLIMSHMMAHKTMMEWAWAQMPSAEAQREQVQSAYADPSTRIEQQQQQVSNEAFQG